MALVECIECSTKISEKAVNCPKCGCTKPFNKTEISCDECGISLPFNHDGVCSNCGNPDITVRYITYKEEKKEHPDRNLGYFYLIYLMIGIITFFYGPYTPNLAADFPFFNKSIGHFIIGWFLFVAYIFNWPIFIFAGTFWDMPSF
ncbi:hypothetical protein QUF74_03145 [Candidatus Halobeggiatoa sp. HSG11]|nr:hypothetical protein [Candidatus Halobeggiatoa sp. HSG11]